MTSYGYFKWGRNCKGFINIFPNILNDFLNDKQPTVLNEFGVFTFIKSSLGISQFPTVVSFLKTNKIYGNKIKLKNKRFMEIKYFDPFHFHKTCKTPESKNEYGKKLYVQRY